MRGLPDHGGLPPASPPVRGRCRDRFSPGQWHRGVSEFILVVLQSTRLIRNDKNLLARIAVDNRETTLVNPHTSRVWFITATCRKSNQRKLKRWPGSYADLRLRGETSVMCMVSTRDKPMPLHFSSSVSACAQAALEPLFGACQFLPRTTLICIRHANHHLGFHPWCRDMLDRQSYHYGRAYQLTLFKLWISSDEVPRCACHLPLDIALTTWR